MNGDSVVDISSNAEQLSYERFARLDRIKRREYRNSKSLIGVLLENKSQGFAAIIFSLLVGLLSLASPIFMLTVFDRALPSRSVETLVVLFIILLVTYLFSALIDYSRKRLFARIGAQLQERTEADIFLMQSQLPPVDRKLDNKCATAGDLDSVSAFIQSTQMLAFFDLMWTPLFVLFAFVIHFALGWIALAYITLATVVSLLGLAVTSKSYRDHMNRSNSVANLSRSFVGGKDTLANQWLLPNARLRWQWQRNHARDSAISSYDQIEVFSTIIRSLRTVAQSAVIALGAYLVIQNTISIGAMIATNFLLVRVFLPVEKIVLNLRTINKFIESWSRLSKTLQQPIGQKYGKGQDSVSGPCELRMSDVVIDIDVAGRRRINYDQFVLPASEMVNIVGDSGSGKSLMSKMLIGGVTPSMGSVTYHGVDLSEIDECFGRGIFGYVSQNPKFIPASVLANITGLSNASADTQAFSIATTLGLHDSIVNLPNGYDEHIDTACQRLSQGELQLLSLARALSANPRILILDEPDTVYQTIFDSPDLQETLRSYCERGGSLVVFSRVPYEKLNFDRSLLLRRGKLTQVKSTMPEIKLSDLDDPAI